LSASQAHAQFNVQDCNSDITTCSALISSTSSSSTALAGGLIFTIVLGANQASALRGFLKRNRVALILDVSRGGGESLHDLARVLGIGPLNHRPFGKKMRIFRKRVTQWILFPPPDEEGFMSMVRWMKGGLGSPKGAENG